MDTPNPAEFEALAVALATEAGALARTRRIVSVEAKSSPTDMVTDVDRAVEEFIREWLGRERPGDAILGEEAGSTSGGRVRWLVDPIDGTVNFVLGLPAWSVSIAAELDAEVVAGCVYNPISSELFRAHRGGGAYVGDVRLAGPRNVPLAQAVVGTGFTYDAARRSRQAAAAAALLPRIADIRRAGSAALDLCSVAAGRLDAHYEAGLNPWDWSAGALIATEAGCAVTDLHGGAPSSRLVVAARPELAAELRAVLAELRADEV